MSRHWITVLLQDVIIWVVEIGKQAIYVWRRVTTTAMEMGICFVNSTPLVYQSHREEEAEETEMVKKRMRGGGRGGGAGGKAEDAEEWRERERGRSEERREEKE